MRRTIYNNNLKNIIPDKKKTESWLDEFYQWFFLNNSYNSYTLFVNKEEELKIRLIELLNCTTLNKKAIEVVKELFSSFTYLYEELEKDVEAILKFDPAAYNKAEIIGTYPGFFAIFVYRVAHQLWNYDIPVFPRLISEIVHGKTGIDIHPGAQIGKRFIIDHGTGVVIGETCVIGDYVKVYQGVTLGALSVSKEIANQKRHPTIGNNVTIYSNATILGGNTVIGNDSVIGGNVWLTSSIPEKSLVYHKSEAIVKSKTVFPEPINYVI
ncbi:MAG TPA: serine O-acetyltransferase [Dysgonamonadaceae bacterium]|nr:serine O-acetyltransferase [Dysgonamonadaceae bacterium]